MPHISAINKKLAELSNEEKADLVITLFNARGVHVDKADKAEFRRAVMNGDIELDLELS